jgi:putative transposase
LIDVDVVSDGRLLTVQRYIERNLVHAGLVERAEDWQWSSASGGHESRPVFDPSPVPRPARRRAYVNQPRTEAELERLPECLQRRRPDGDAAWTVKKARRMDLEACLRPRGRPRKNQGPESSLFGEEERAG